MRNTRRVSTAIVLATLAGIAAAGEPQLPVKLQPGQWQLKELGETGGSRLICLNDPGKVLQIAHGDTRCTRTIVESSAIKVAVRYSCPGRGGGRSTLTFGSATSFRLQTQGMDSGAPFDFDYDARRVGDCPAAVPTPAH